MDYKLAKEIYGQPWFMDSISAQVLGAVLNNNNFEFNANEKLNQYGFIAAANVIENNNYFDYSRLKENEKYISVVNFNGAITKGGGASHNGTAEIGAQMLKADKQNNIIGHIIKADSGGGSVEATLDFLDVLAQLKKPVVTYNNGTMASAMYYIASQTAYIISHRASNMVGSIGTMISINGVPNNTENKVTGERTIRIYASKATLKNNDFEAAINDFNIEPIQTKILNPANENFINAVQSKRAGAEEQHLTGDIFAASEVIGTLIDKIGTFEDAIKKVQNLYSINLKNNTMTKEELKAQHSAIYNEILHEGIMAERDRVEAIMTYVDVDAAAVIEMVASGANPNQKFFAEMNRKALAADLLANAKSEAAPVIEVKTETAPADNVDAEYETALLQAKKAAGLI
jgi:protease-4